MRIGHGYDVHRLAPDRALILGGVHIPHPLGLLGQVRERITAAGYEIGNIDVTVIAQKPKLAPHIPEMRGNLCRVLGLGEDQINIKATTEEHLGFTGSEEGMACHAVCLLK